MKEHYDIIVVGGGPGGSWAAKHAAEKGISVLLLEKDREIGIPVRCAEGVSQLGIQEVIDVDERWIAQVIRGARLVAPDGTAVDSYPDEAGFILHRRLFDADLAGRAAQAGCDIITKAYVRGLLHDKGRVSGVQVSHLGMDHSIACSIVIGADGVESRVGRWAGLKTRISPSHMASCVQMILSGIQIDPELVQFYFGMDVAPGGYLWIFPKGPNSANVGLGISGDHSNTTSAVAYLKKYVSHHYPDASILGLTAGGVPLVPTLDRVVVDGLMLVGDAARQVNPMSGGGIVNAMIAGRIAGSVAADAVLGGDISAKRLSAYPRKWNKAEGKNNEWSYRIKQVVNTFSDEDLNHIARLLLEVPPEKRTAFRIFKTALRKQPKLILQAAKIFI